MNANPRLRHLLPPFRLKWFLARFGFAATGRASNCGTRGQGRGSSAFVCSVSKNFVRWPNSPNAAHFALSNPPPVTTRLAGHLRDGRRWGGVQSIVSRRGGGLVCGEAAQPPVTSYREFTSAKPGCIASPTSLTDRWRAAIHACCHKDFCLKRRLWTVQWPAPDSAGQKSPIPCLEPCAIMLEGCPKSGPRSRMICLGKMLLPGINYSSPNNILCASQLCIIFCLAGLTVTCGGHRDNEKAPAVAQTELLVPTLKAKDANAAWSELQSAVHTDTRQPQSGVRRRRRTQRRTDKVFLPSVFTPCRAN